MHPVGAGGGGGVMPAYLLAQMRAGGGLPAGAFGGGGAALGPMMSLLSPAARQPAPTQTQPRGGGGKAKVPRPPTAYNLHMRAELKRLKVERPALEHRDAWRLASGSVRFPIHAP